ncbi:MAG: TetR/AcrR family transcriptional regulator [Deltaproteobacteria bacterium]|nr:TetR/AcrR family transcriptional regulator [Deltaproteobacteria bacterium]MBW2445100.1 TetR/AcrR family transcriptional regulator [Deltaproteobacteria bacterium]
MGPDEKRFRILEAARRVCTREGYEAATMEAIAAEARVSKGTLYNFFESKEHLFLSTVLQSYDEAEARFDGGPSEDPRVRLDGFLEAMIESFPHVAAGMMVNLQVWAVVSRDADSRTRMFEDLSQRYGRLGADLETTLSAGQRAGVFRPDFAAAAVAAGLLAVLDGYVYRSVFDPGRAGARDLRASFDALIRERVLVSGTEEGR